MHIGRAQQLPPDHPEVAAQRVQQARVAQDAELAAAPTVAETSAPTGETPAQAPQYHPVSDLIQRFADRPDSPPPPPDAPRRAYDGTPPAPHVVDLKG